jgi:hypothetical protein
MLSILTCDTRGAHLRYLGQVPFGDSTICDLGVDGKYMYVYSTLRNVPSMSVFNWEECVLFTKDDLNLPINKTTLYVSFLGNFFLHTNDTLYCYCLDNKKIKLFNSFKGIDGKLLFYKRYMYQCYSTNIRCSRWD